VIGKSKILFLLIFFTVTNAYSQHLSHQVLVPAAGVILSGGYDYSQTIGESAVELAGSDYYLLTQGFQQPKMKLAVVNILNGNGVKVYPNPVVDFVDVELWGENPRDFRVSVININGTIVHSEDLKFLQNFWHVLEIPVSGLVRGFYIVRVLSKDGVIYRTFKIEKM
jgi:hypothetical protein